MKKSIKTTEEARQRIQDLQSTNPISQAQTSLIELNTQLDQANQMRDRSKTSLKKVYTQPFANAKSLNYFFNNHLPWPKNNKPSIKFLIVLAKIIPMVVFYTLGSVAIAALSVLGLVFFPCIALAQYLLARNVLANVCTKLNAFPNDQEYISIPQESPSVSGVSLRIFTHAKISEYSKAEISVLTPEQLELFVLKVNHGLQDWPLTHLCYLTEEQIAQFEYEKFPGANYTYANIIRAVQEIDFTKVSQYKEMFFINKDRYMAQDGVTVNASLTLEQFSQCTRPLVGNRSRRNSLT